MLVWISKNTQNEVPIKFTSLWDVPHVHDFWNGESIVFPLVGSPYIWHKFIMLGEEIMMHLWMDEIKMDEYVMDEIQMDKACDGWTFDGWNQNGLFFYGWFYGWNHDGLNLWWIKSSWMNL